MFFPTVLIKLLIIKINTYAAVLLFNCQTYASAEPLPQKTWDCRLVCDLLNIRVALNLWHWVSKLGVWRRTRNIFYESVVVRIRGIHKMFCIPFYFVCIVN